MDQTLSSWLQALQADDPSLRWQAAEALGLLGDSEPRAVVAALAYAVHDPDLDVRLQAVVALTALQARAENAVPALETALQDGDSDLRRQVAVALGSIGPLAEEASATLGRLLRDPNTNVRLSAVRALQSIGPDAVAALDDLAGALKDKVPSVRRAAAETLGPLAADYPHRTARTAKVLADALKDGDPEVRRQSARALGVLGPLAALALEELGEASRTGSEALRQEASGALGRIGGQALPQLQRNLEYVNADVRRLAADHLRLLRFEARPVFAVLCRALSDSDSAVAHAAMTTLRLLDPEPKDVQPILTVALRHQDAAVRAWAVNWLGEVALGIERLLAREAVAALIPMLADDAATVRRETATVLGALGAEAGSAVSGLLHLLHDADRAVRLQAALALGRIDPVEARQAVPALLQALPATTVSRYSSEPYNREAVAALAAIGAVEPLIEALSHRNDGIRAGATQALVLMGTKAQAAIPHLRQGLSAGEPAVRLRSASALQSMTPDPEAVLPVLLEALANEDSDVRHWATNYLSELAGGGDLTPKARATLQPLTARLDDANSAVREGAALALGNIVEQLRRSPGVLANEEQLVQALMARLKDVHVPIRQQAALALGKIGAARRGQGPIRQAIPALLAMKDARPFSSDAATALGRIGLVVPLVEALTEADEKVRAGAAHALGLIGQEARAAVPVLRSVLRQDRDCHVRAQSALALAEIGRSGAAAVPDLVEALKDADEEVRTTALRALAALGPEADTAAAALVGVLSDPASGLRQAASDALAAIGPGAVTALSETLGSEQPDTIILAAQALQGIGVRARAAIPALLAAFRATDETLATFGNVLELLRTMRRTTALALAAIVPGIEDAEVIPALALALEDVSPDQKRRLVDLLWAADELPRFAARVVPFLAAELRRLAEGYGTALENVTQRLAQTLARLGPAASAALPSLLDELDRQLLQPIPATVAEDGRSSPLLFEIARTLRAILAPTIAFPDLVRTLRQAGLDERQTTLVLGVAGDEAVPALLERLQHRNARVRLAAALALGERAPKTREVRAVLAEALGDDHRPVRLACLDAMFRSGKDAPDVRNLPEGLVKAVEHWDGATRVRAGQRLAELERDERRAANGDRAVVELATAVLLAALQRHPLSSDTVRVFVTQMGRFKHTFALLPASDDPDPEVRRQVLDVLGQANLWQVNNELTDGDRVAVQSLLERALSDRQETVRRQAVRGLGQLAAGARSSVGVLHMALSDRQSSVRAAAVLALWKIERRTETVLPLLIASLEQESCDRAGLIEQMRQGHASEVLQTLAEMDTQAEAALLRALADEQATVRAGAAVALGARNTPAPATVGLALSAALVDDPKALVRLQAAEALRFQGRADQAAIVSRLIDSIKEDPHRDVALAALITLGDLGPHSEREPDPYLLALVGDEEERWRSAGVRTLGRWGKHAEKAIPNLRLALKDRSPTVRERAAQSLADIGAAALPALTEAFTDKDAELRRHVVNALGRLGAAAVPLLREALKDGDEEVRAAAAAALGP